MLFQEISETTAFNTQPRNFRNKGSAPIVSSNLSLPPVYVLFNTRFESKASLHEPLMKWQTTESYIERSPPSDEHPSDRRPYATTLNLFKRSVRLHPELAHLVAKLLQSLRFALFGGLFERFEGNFLLRIDFVFQKAFELS